MTVRDHPILRGLHEDLASTLLELGSEETYEAGAFLFREGEPADRFFLVLGGRVALEVHIPGRGPVQTETLGPGDILGLSWLFPPFRWQLDARAVESTRVFVLPGQLLRGEMEEGVSPMGYALARHMLAALYERLKRARLRALDVYGPGP